MKPVTPRIARVLPALVAALALSALTAQAVTVFRFPKPEFQSGYNVPLTQLFKARSDIMEWVDVGALFAALALSAALALKWRSRRGMLLLTAFSVAYFGFYRKGCVCSVGALQNVTQALVAPSVVLPATVVAFFVLPLAFALLYGRVFCASVCPLGALQELVAVRPVHLPTWLNRALGLLRHLYLAMAVVLVVSGAGFVVCRFDPFVGFFRLGASPSMLIFGAAVLALGVFIARPYCRFACPYGVLLGWASLLARRHVAITPDDCIQCRLCEGACPFGAILPPTPARAPEPRATGVRRVGAVLACLPVIVLASAWAGAGLDLALSRAHRTVSLAERVQLEDAGRVEGATLASDAFRRSGLTRDELIRRALAIRAPLRRAGGWMGAYMGLVIGTTLLGLCVRRARRDFLPDRMTCLSCARCFQTCPREQVRLGRAGSGGAAPLTAGRKPGDDSA